MELTHFDEQGNARMVDVGEKAETQREAVAVGRIQMNEETYQAVQQGSMSKGDVLGVARIAGITGAKKTSDLIPLTHNINLTKVTLDFKLYPMTREIEASCTVRTFGRTGVEMEAITGVSIALLTIYDMCKALDKGMEIGQIYLQKKTGGKSGDVYNRRQVRKED
ncbi:cyclic pyranopterin monophosphate synthase MoaC [Diplocloster hominis]|uniref:cyclic pyranopterin monophosphate synthase MoaC n=1 Tax=Diplocloster hominis TaxID=3079010 RepID=UPI0031BB6830